MMGYVRRRRELADETFEIEVHDVLANDENGVVIATGRATRGGDARMESARPYRFAASRIAECWLFPEDLYEFDRIWS